MDLLIQMGNESGYEGNALQEFVKKRQDVEMDRETRGKGIKKRIGSRCRKEIGRIR